MSTLDWVVGHPSSDVARLHANRRIFMTLLGDLTAPVSSTRQLLGNQEFAIVKLPASAQKTYTSRGASTRQRIVDATVSLIYAKGVEGTSLDDVRGAAVVLIGARS